MNTNELILKMAGQKVSEALKGAEMIKEVPAQTMSVIQDEIDPEIIEIIESLMQQGAFDKQAELQTDQNEQPNLGKRLLKGAFIGAYGEARDRGIANNPDNPLKWLAIPAMAFGGYHLGNGLRQAVLRRAKPSLFMNSEIMNDLFGRLNIPIPFSKYYASIPTLGFLGAGTGALTAAGLLSDPSIV